VYSHRLSTTLAASNKQCNNQTSHAPLAGCEVDSACSKSNRLSSLKFVGDTLSVSALISLVILTFDLLTLKLVRFIARVVRNWTIFLQIFMCLGRLVLETGENRFCVFSPVFARFRLFSSAFACIRLFSRVFARFRLSPDGSMVFFLVFFPINLLVWFVQ